MRVLGDMGCGRSKAASQSSDSLHQQDAYIKAVDKKNSHNSEENKKKKNSESPAKGQQQQRKSSENNSTQHVDGGGKLSNGEADHHRPLSNGNMMAERMAQHSGSTKDKPLAPLQLNPQVTASQLEFFRMLDEKIEQGKDYDPSVKT